MCVLRARREDVSGGPDGARAERATHLDVTRARLVTVSNSGHCMLTHAPLPHPCRRA